MSTRHLVVMAAGTGGHVIPGLAIAREMLARGWTVSWLGTTTGMENRLVPPAGLPMDTIAFTGLRGKGLLHTATGGLRLLAAFIACWRILRRRRPTVVLGMGGYVCFPGGLMAALLGRPLALVNADASLLMSNRWLLPVADAITFGFDGEGHQLDKGVVTGNPVRAEIESLSPPEQRFAGREGPLRLLVVGGSLGAAALNEALPQALLRLPPEQRPQVLHQAGEKQIDGLRQTYATLQLEGELRPFIDDMAAAYADADLVICRAGALTVAELAAVGVASLLVPYPHAVDDHQTGNARFLAEHGAAYLLPQAELTPERLAGILSSLDRSRLQAMAECARALARPQAADEVAAVCAALASSKTAAGVNA